MKYLLLFTIGPVKSFITESRKTQDLYASSALLSHLCNLAMQEAKTVFKDIEIITPQQTAGKVSIPNRFIAEISDEENGLNQKAQKIKDKLIADFSSIQIGNTKITLPLGAEEQLREHLDIRWVFYPLTEGYDLAFKKINKELAAIKNANPFEQIAEKGRKCIVDGKRNVKFYRETKENEISIQNHNKLYNKLYQPENHVNIYKSKNDEDELKIWHLQKGEGISAVSLKKRLFLNEPHSFPSTPYVSLMHLFNSLKDDDSFYSYKSKVQRENPEDAWLDHSDDQLFYFDNIERIFIEADKTNEELRECQYAHKIWSKTIPNKLFTTYYVLIRFDGDKMGDWFSGAFLTKGQDLKAFHKQLSLNIGEFSDEIQTLIKEPQGRVVYAGGEDFMAFVNIHHLKSVVDLINCKFGELILNNKLKTYIEPDKNISLSMGISIAHYKEPLQMVLDKTANMEKLAKNSGRNRFALNISKHSGAQIIMSQTWEKLMPIFNTVQAVVKKEFSSAFLLNVYDFCKQMNFSNDIGKNILQSKIKLFVKRAKTPGIPTKNMEKINQNLNELMLKDGVLNVSNFAETLLSIDFLQRQYYE